jgi:hypothetical protein
VEEYPQLPDSAFHLLSLAGDGADRHEPIRSVRLITPKMKKWTKPLLTSPTHTTTRGLFNARCSGGLLGPGPPIKSCDHAPMCCFIAPSQDQSGRSSLRLFVQLRTPVQTKPMIRTTSAPSSKYFKQLFIAPKRLTPLLPRKNVQQEPTECYDGDHQKSGGQNNIGHDNASSALVVVKTRN